MDMNFWQQFCTSPLPGGSSSPDPLSDLDSSPGWSPLSSLEDQENYALPLQQANYPHHQQQQYQQQHQQQQQQYSDTASTTSSTSSSSSLQCQFSPPLGGLTDPAYPHHHPHRPSRQPKNPVKRVQQRTAANHRERKRMKTINEAFEGLRERIPLANGDRKLSKVDTLRLAIRYIHHLSDMVTTCGKVEGGLTGPAEPDQAKVIIRCHGADFQDYCGDANGNFPLYGHSLSWANDKPNKVGANGRLVAKLWVPESADPTTLQETYDCDAMSL